jgi:hypothetical protein
MPGAFTPCATASQHRTKHGQTAGNSKQLSTMCSCGHVVLPQLSQCHIMSITRVLMYSDVVMTLGSCGPKVAGLKLCMSILQQHDTC